MAEEKLSEHFSRRELACRCCGRCEIDPRLVAALEDLRRLAGRPVVVTSAYRCPERNRRVGGARNSLHVQGRAADVRIPGLSVREMFALADRVEAFHQGGIGVYPDEVFIHVDVRGKKARWARMDGRYVGLEEVGLA